jgi:hypothetical protein
VEEPGLPTEFGVDATPAVLDVERIAVVVPVAVTAARGVAPAPVGR